MSLLEFAEQVRAEAMEALGDRYVEMWVAEKQDSFVVGVLDLRPGEAERLSAMLSTAVNVEVVGRAISREEMNGFEKQVQAAIDGVPWSTVSVNYERGTVMVGIPDAQDIARAAANLERKTGRRALTGDTATNLNRLFDFTGLVDHPRVGVVYQPRPALTDSQEIPPAKGGKKISDPAGGYCTAGFMVSGFGGAFILTAGHCGANGTRMRLGAAGPSMGVIQNNTYWNAPFNLTADAAVVHVGSVAWEPHVYVEPSAYRLVVAQADGHVSGDPTVPYAWVCFTGATTVTSSCGYITSTNTTIGSSGRDGRDHSMSDQIAVRWTSGPGVQLGDSGGPLYGLVADGSAIALGLLSVCDGDASRRCASGGQAYFTKISNALNQTGTTLITAGRPPFGHHDQAIGGADSVTIGGWVIDPDLSLTAATVHVYIGGPAGSGAPGYAVSANTYRPDVGAAYPNTGTHHGFSAIITTSVRGTNVPVYIYGIDMGGNFAGNTLLTGGPRYVNIGTSVQLRGVNGKCLDANANDGYANGGRVQLWECHGGDNQKWQLLPDNTLRGAGGKCLDANANDGYANGTRIQLWDCHGAGNQKWVGQPP